MKNEQKANFLAKQLKGASEDFKSGFLQGAKIALDAESKGENLHLHDVSGKQLLYDSLKESIELSKRDAPYLLTKKLSEIESIIIACADTKGGENG